VSEDTKPEAPPAAVPEGAVPLSIRKVEEGLKLGDEWLRRALALKKPGFGSSADILFIFRQALHATSYPLGVCGLVLDSDAPDDVKTTFEKFRKDSLEIHRQIRAHGISLGMEREQFERAYAEFKLQITKQGAQPG
jgi:hypothetical protein